MIGPSFARETCIISRIRDTNLTGVHALDGHALHNGTHGSDLSLMLKTALVVCLAVGVHKDELTNTHARHYFECTARHVAHLKHLSVRHAGLHEG